MCRRAQFCFRGREAALLFGGRLALQRLAVGALYGTAVNSLLRFYSERFAAGRFELRPRARCLLRSGADARGFAVASSCAFSQKEIREFQAFKKLNMARIWQ